MGSGCTTRSLDAAPILGGIAVFVLLGVILTILGL